MEIYFDTVASKDERSEVEQWSAANDAPDIEFVSIEIEVVSVHGSKADFVAMIGTARRQGHLSTELTEALADMRSGRTVSKKGKR